MARSCDFFLSRCFLLLLDEGIALVLVFDSLRQKNIILAIQAIVIENTKNSVTLLYFRMNNYQAPTAQYPQSSSPRVTCPRAYRIV